MFSGIIEKIGRVNSRSAETSSVRLNVVTGFDELELGESIAINGVCLTVAGIDCDGGTDFFVSAESLSRSNIGSLSVDAAVNVERSVTLATRLSGHLVQGHVDAKATLSSVTRCGEAIQLELSLPRDLSPYCVPKGSIAINGISLTLNEVGTPSEFFTVAITIIPHTWHHTNLQFCAVGDELNVEVDVLAKYVERLCQVYPRQ
jgi:riboflavin synthase